MRATIHNKGWTRTKFVYSFDRFPSVINENNLQLLLCDPTWLFCWYIEAEWTISSSKQTLACISFIGPHRATAISDELVSLGLARELSIYGQTHRTEPILGYCPFEKEKEKEKEKWKYLAQRFGLHKRNISWGVIVVITGLDLKLLYGGKDLPRRSEE